MAIETVQKFKAVEKIKMNTKYLKKLHRIHLELKKFASPKFLQVKFRLTGKHIFCKIYLVQFLTTLSEFWSYTFYRRTLKSPNLYIA